MSGLAPLREHDATGLAALVRSREVAPEELVRWTLEAIERHNPELNAVVARLDDFAVEAARGELPNGPFRGVPFLIKDHGLWLAGVPTGSGSRYFQGATRPYDSELVARYRRAGFVICGKTGTAELGTSGSTDNAAHGIMRNPWDLDRGPGPSSGGSAAAVAAGLVTAAHATDAGGSLRGPASWCGLVGLKPTRGRLSYAPDAGEHWLGLGTHHVVTRSVRDTAAILDCTAGPATGDPHVAPLPERSFLDEAGWDPPRLRIGFCGRGPRDLPFPEPMVDALMKTVRLLERLGHHVEEAAPSWDPTLLGEAVLAICATVVGDAVAERHEATGIAPSPALLERSNLWLLEKSREFSAVDLLRATRKLNTVSRSFAAFFENHDVWLTPTVGDLPPPVGFLNSGAQDVTLLYDRLWRLFRFNSVYNASGCPAISLPLHQSAEGLPIGMMFGARFGAEGLLLSLAGQLERAEPWAGRRPPYGVSPGS